jgi:pantothenate synthetase
MQIIHTIEDLRFALGAARKSGKSIGLVPTICTKGISSLCAAQGQITT